MSSPIRAILFDVGGVLVRTFDLSGRQAWEQRLGLPPGGAEAVVLNSEMGHRAQRGEIGDETLWSWVGERLALGVRVLAIGLMVAAGLRLVLPKRDAGMLAVRHRAIDVTLLAALGGLLYFLAVTIPDQPG